MLSTRFCLLAVTAASLSLVACGPAARTDVDGNTTTGDGNNNNNGDGNNSNSNCTADGVDLIYVVDDQNNFQSFNPRRLGMNPGPFTQIAKLTCPGAGSANPFSMSVDRNGIAWVLYSSGDIFKVNITTGACSASGYTKNQMGMKVFGMGFVTDAAGSNSEKLFIGGGTDTAAPGGKFAQIDTTAASPSPVILGNLRSDTEQSPELTGTAEGKIYGFYPGASKAFVQEINRANGGGMGTELRIPGGLGGQASAWAFAFWGGKFYIFVTTGDILSGENSTVRVIDRATGAASTPLQNLSHNYVGAGVSTCAPVVVE